MAWITPQVPYEVPMNGYLKCVGRKCRSWIWGRWTGKTHPCKQRLAWHRSFQCTGWLTTTPDMETPPEMDPRTMMVSKGLGKGTPPGRRPPSAHGRTSGHQAPSPGEPEDLSGKKWFRACCESTRPACRRTSERTSARPRMSKRLSRKPLAS